MTAQTYVIVVSVFLNARHYFVANGRTGQTHPHTWRLQSEVEVPAAGNAGEGIVGFADLQRHIQQVVAPLEGALLNSHPFFATEQPTTENLARVLFAKIDARLSELGVVLRELSAWETPTRGTVVTRESAAQAVPTDPIRPGSIAMSADRHPLARFPVVAGTADAAGGGALGAPFVLVPMQVAFPNVTTPPGAYALLPLDATETSGPLADTAAAVESASAARAPEPAVADPGAETESPTPAPAGAALPIAGAAHPPAAELNAAVAAESVAQVAVTAEELVRVPRGGRRRRTAQPTEAEAPAEAQPPAPLSWGSVLTTVGAVLLIVVATVLIYGRLLATPADLRFPWGSDTWGHLWKAEYLLQHLEAGDGFPTFTAAWYNGIEPFRHWAPLPYFLLLGLRLITNDIFRAGHLYVVLCALVGSVSWLAFRRHLGWVASIGAALVWLLWPDHLRVSFSEGNLPRVLGTALAPLVFYTFLRVLESERPRLHHLLGLVGAMHLVVLSHAMVGAIYAASLSLFTLLHLLLGGGRWQRHARAMGLLILGILTAGWWLLPSLVGGLVGQGEADYSQVITFLSPADSFNPTLRYRNPDIFYWGLGAIPLLGYGFFTWKQRPIWSRAALVSSIVLITITFPFIRSLYLSLPLHHLLWPIRFASFAGVLFLAGGLLSPAGAPSPSRRTLLTVISAGLVFLLLLDGSGSAHLATARQANPEVATAISQIPADEPARVAVLDQSALGSVPSFLLSHSSRREQIFGWAWQGATTSASLVWLNTALVEGHYPFLFDRLLEMGTTDIIALRRLVDEDLFAETAARFGFMHTWEGDGLDLYRRPGGPFATTVQYKALAIGQYASNLAYIFPQVEVAGRGELDSFSVAELSRYETVILAGPTWKKRAAAETLIRELVQNGVRVVVDMAGMPLGVLSKRPEFLGVYGEPISLGAAAPGIQRNAGEVVILQPFPSTDGTWHTMIPQGIDEEDGFIRYFGAPTATFGTLSLPEGKVTFAGLNLIFHAARTRDPAAVALLAELLALEPDVPPVRTPLPLTQWEPDESGAHLSLHVPANADRVIVPIAGLDSLQITGPDSHPLQTEPIHHLIGLHLDPGDQELTLRVHHTRWHTVGLVVSAAAVVSLLLTLWMGRREEQE